MPPALPSLFHSLNDVDVYTALRHFREVDVADGKTILEEGMPADIMLIVVSGALDLSSRGVWLGRAVPGDIVGETSLFEYNLRTATATTHGPTRLMVLERSGYERLRDVLHPMGQILERTCLDLQVARLRSLGDRIAELSEGQRHEPRVPGAGFFSAVTSMFGRGGIFGAETIDTLASLRKCPPFADLEEDVLGPIADRLTPVVYGAGAFVCTEGEMSDQMFFLDDGDIDVVVATHEDRVQPLTTLKPGAAFGMVTLAQKRPRMSSCIARTRVVALALDLESWDALIADPHFTGSVFRRAMVRVLADQVGYTNRQLTALSEATMDTTGKIRRATAALEAHGEYLQGTSTPAPRRT